MKYQSGDNMIYVSKDRIDGSVFFVVRRKPDQLGEHRVRGLPLCNTLEAAEAVLVVYAKKKGLAAI
jgi:hypothetical protein